MKPNLEYIRDTFGLEVWEQILESLSEEDRREIEFAHGVGSYPVQLEDRVTRALVSIRFPNNPRAAGEAFYKMGRHTADANLSGIYSVFLRLASPERTLKRVPSMFETIYQGVSAGVSMDADGKGGVVTVSGLGDVAYMGPRLIGWAERALERLGAKGITVTERAWERGEETADPLEYVIRWE